MFSGLRRGGEPSKTILPATALLPVGPAASAGLAAVGGAAASLPLPEPLSPQAASQPPSARASRGMKKLFEPFLMVSCSS